jgi:anthraniloyl-CoA monooxygenase
VRSTGHGFCGLARKRLLQILHERCAELGIAVHFETDIEDVEAHKRDADLLLGCDGLNSRVRERWADAFKPDIRMGSTHFSWLGCDKQLDAFTFIFRENEHGLWRVHAYPFAEGLSTFIVEGTHDAWLAAGLEHADESDTVAYCNELFADHLDGARLLTNRSIWRQFPTVRNERWHHENVVLMGDAAHTAHFSIGSGTKLAMEDAIALAEAFERHGDADIPKVLETYQEARWLDALKIQRVARTSRTWFEDTERYVHQHPLQFTFGLMSRSKQITWDNLAVRDPELMDQVRDWWWDHEADAPRAADGSAPPPMFAPLKLRDLELANRVVVSPMCQYSAVDGVVNDWHLMHLGSRAVGGAGLIITEMTDVSPEGRITHGCAGMWNDEQMHAWKRVVDFVHEHSGAAIGQQLAHAGRKASCHLPWEGDDPLSDDGKWPTLGPSALPFDQGWPAPKAMDRADMDKVRDDFVAAAKRADEAGFDLIELHMAHGYLLSSFLSPASNRRDDEYGGSLENRLRFPLEVFQAVRAVWPAHKPLSVRVSATDWLDEGKGQTLEETVEIVRVLREHGLDVIDVSSAGNTPESQPDYGRMYQVPFAERIRQEVDVPVMAVGAILGHDHCNTILAAGRADLCALARPHLVNPHVTLGAAVAYEYQDQVWPRQYLPAKPRPRR